MEQPTITIDDFNKLDLRVARIARAEQVDGQRVGAFHGEKAGELAVEEINQAIKAAAASGHVDIDAQHVVSHFSQAGA